MIRSDTMELSERKKLILNAIVSEYIDTAEPVSSVTIVNKYNAGCSSATVRNEMSDLEEMGYLDKPHTSAGRMPSGRGYRFYVNSMFPYKAPQEAGSKLRRAFLSQLSETDDLIEKASDFISRFTNYTVIATDSYENMPRRIYTGGVVNIFNHPEYKNLEKARRLISFIDSRDSIYKVISELDGGERVRILIGDENPYEALKDCSIVISHYRDARGRRGGLGIIGPTRMHYDTVVSSLETVTEMLEKLISEKEI